VHFAAEFTARFSGKISKGSAGEPGLFFFAANDLNFFREHFFGSVDFKDIDGVVTRSADLAMKFYERLVKRGVLAAE
jgi:hypothetical protein